MWFALRKKGEMWLSLRKEGRGGGGGMRLALRKEGGGMPGVAARGYTNLNLHMFEDLCYPLKCMCVCFWGGGGGSAVCVWFAYPD